MNGAAEQSGQPRDSGFWETGTNVLLRRRLRGTRGTHTFQAALRRAGLPRIRFHDLRHTAASLLLGRGVHPKIASDMLGHSSVAITMDLYSHVSPTMQRGAADALDAALSGSA